MCVLLEIATRGHTAGHPSCWLSRALSWVLLLLISEQAAQCLVFGGVLSLYAQKLRSGKWVGLGAQHRLVNGERQVFGGLKKLQVPQILMSKP